MQKWGNSLALRIPRAFAREVGIDQDMPVELSVIGRTLVVTPVAEPALSLEELLAGVTEENLHQQVGTGPATGKEAW